MLEERLLPLCGKRFSELICDLQVYLRNRDIKRTVPSMNIGAARSGAGDMNGGGRENAQHGAAESVFI